MGGKGEADCLGGGVRLRPSREVATLGEGGHRAAQDLYRVCVAKMGSHVGHAFVRSLTVMTGFQLKTVKILSGALTIKASCSVCACSLADSGYFSRVLRLHGWGR